MRDGGGAIQVPPDPELRATPQTPTPATPVTPEMKERGGGMSAVTIEYDGVSHTVEPGAPFDIGRDADLVLDNNPYLHRRLLRVVYEHDFWWVLNVGGTTVATVYAPGKGVQAWLKPSTRLPLVFGDMEVVFTAGPCTYRLTLQSEEPVWQDTPLPTGETGDATVDSLAWTESQRVAIVALAEAILRRDSRGIVHIPSNVEAARRIGWTVKRFEKKIDNICSKLDRLGIDGMRGGVREHAMGRRARLVEWAVSSGTVTSADLSLLDDPVIPDNDDW